MAIASTLETGSFVILSDAGRETPATMIREIDALGFAGKVVHARVALAEPASSSEESARVGDLLEQARSENGPLVLVFSGIFCLVCARLDKETLANSRVMAALKQVIFHRIKVEEDRAAARAAP